MSDLGCIVNEFSLVAGLVYKEISTALVKAIFILFVFLFLFGIRIIACWRRVDRSNVGLLKLDEGHEGLHLALHAG